MPQLFGITVTAKMRHAALWRARQQCGSAKKLAEKLGVSYGTINDWVNLRSVPSICKTHSCKTQKGQESRDRMIGRFWTKERVANLEKTLFDLTGQTLQELFPPELCANEEFLSARKQIEQTREFTSSMLGHFDDARYILPPPDEEVANAELRDVIKARLKTLSYREREILKLRYGLFDGYTYTLEEVGHIFKVTKDRISQIEKKALRRLQAPQRAKGLSDFVLSNDSANEDQASFNVRRRVVMHQSEPRF